MTLALEENMFDCANRKNRVKQSQTNIHLDEITHLAERGEHQSGIKWQQTKWYLQKFREGHSNIAFMSKVQSVEICSLKTLITILTIENSNLNIHSDFSIKM